MYENINKNELDTLINQDPRFQLIIETMLENHKRIISTIGHEIRNPLTILYSNIQLFLDKNPEFSTHTYFNNILQDTLYMTQLLDELTLYNNSNHLRYEQVQTTTYLRSIILSFAAGLENSNISITSKVPDLPDINIDKTKMKQVILNILKNAKEACSENGNINFNTYFQEDKLFMIFADDGCGIPNHKLDEIFIPFHTTKDSGTGLGLSVCAEIIKAHEGSITVSSIPQEGTSFIIEIPYL